ncbi:hypothetical protein LTR53_003575 [Teratosphaeriaceae sp. CCFEE 6253]|nr:hypothetical protein LTR53_003575 [Teratosphaeriaceae sp. CCFEE 6253]
MAEVGCPFCGVRSESFVIEAHIEEEHAEYPSTAEHDAALAQHLAAPRNAHENVDEHLAVHASLSDLDSEMKSAVSPHSEKTVARHAKSERSCSPQRHKAKPSPTLLEYFSGTSHHGKPRPQPQQAKKPLPQGRLGRRELGPHAFEKQMPEHVRRRLLHDALPHRVNRLSAHGRLTQESTIDNETAGLVPLLATLCARDPTIQTAYLCHPAVKHIAKLRCDGNFCGFWNIQMLLSHLQAVGALPHMRGSMPNVLDIQDTIERAWAHGILPHGRTETGGIRGTRKWIGTSEAAAYFTELGIGVEPLAFQDEGRELAVKALLDHVEAYFLGGLEHAETRGVSRVTQLPPIYFQRRGHSMTIVGLLRNRDGSRALLVFDPSFETSGAVRAMLAGKQSRGEVGALLKPYRRSEEGLARWKEFEIVVPRARAGVVG